MSLSITRRRTTRPAAAPLSIRAMAATYQERRALARMSPERLADMGISAHDAAIEVARPFWDVPTRRR